MNMCLYCGRNASPASAHSACRSMLDKFRFDLSKTPEGLKHTVFQAAENGRYGSAPARKTDAPKRCTACGELKSRDQYYTRQTGTKGKRYSQSKCKPCHSKLMNDRYHSTRKPEWQDRFFELRALNLEYAPIAEILSNEGYVSHQGKKISVDMLRCRVSNLKKKSAV